MRSSSPEQEPRPDEIAERRLSDRSAARIPRNPQLAEPLSRPNDHIAQHRPRKGRRRCRRIINMSARIEAVNPKTVTHRTEPVASVVVACSAVIAVDPSGG